MKLICKISKILIMMTFFTFLFCSACFADGEGALITVEAPESAAVGSTIDVNIVLSGAENLYGGKIAVSFDRKKLRINSISAGSAISGLTVTTNMENEEYQSIITFASAQTKDINGVIAELSFTVTASGEAKINIADARFNDSLTTVIDYSVSSAVVTAYENNLTADVNSDGNVDLLDAVCVLKYLSGEITLDEEALAAADADGNGIVEKDDAAVILKTVSKIQQ